MVILINSSKTMVSKLELQSLLRPPQLLDRAVQLDRLLKTYSPKRLTSLMHISQPLAVTTHQLIADWTTKPDKQTVAIDSFAGDIYRGLQASQFTEQDRQYADKSLVILSGLYGAIRPLDAICPYRLEMMYKLKGKGFQSLYEFWQDAIAKCLPSTGPIINITSQEYMKVIEPFVDAKRIIAPQFLTASGKPGDQTFVAVHAKVARGAFAQWLIKHRIETVQEMQRFNQLGYAFNKELSQPNRPTFICNEFGGLGLKV